MSRYTWTITLALSAAACGGGGDGVSSSKADTGTEGGGGESPRPDATSNGGALTPDARPEGGTVVPRDASTGGGGGGGTPGDATVPDPDQGGGCPAGADNCACLPDDRCDPGFYCESGVCTGCLPGLPDCPCGARGTCGDGLTCVADVCRECTPDVAGCPCGPQNACGAGLTCDADDDVCRPFLDCAAVTCAEHQVCRAEAGGDAACLPECMPGYTWNAGTESCDAQVGANCTPGAAGSIAAQCAGLSRLCLEVDDGAQCGACVNGTTDDAGALMACRPFDTCMSLLCGGENRGCVAPPEGEDAACGDCLAGFAERGGVCVSDVPPTCVPDQPGSIAPMCAAENRACEPNGGAAQCGACLAGYHAAGPDCVVDVPTCDPGSAMQTQCDDALRLCVDAPGGAACGDCVEGFVDVVGECLSLTCDAMECGLAHRSCDGAPIGGCGPCLDGFDAADPDDPAGACLPHQTCGPNSCAAGQFCVEQGAGMPPLCNARPCPEGEALRQNVVNGVPLGEGVCVVCQIQACNGEGERGLSPYTIDNDNRCFCETLPGYFVNDNDFGTQKCDADGDGYVNVTAATYFGPGADRHLRENARCDVQTIERVDLVNELGQTYSIAVCDDGLQRPEDGPCAGPGGIGLWEDEATDDPSAPFLTGVKNPEYPAGARRLRPEELNPLTRACAAGADVNANGIDDVGEAQGTAAVGYNSTLRPFVDLGYFIELYASTYAQNVPSGNDCATDADCGSDFCMGGRCGARRGVLTIRERSRCDADFPLGYRGPEAGDADAADGDLTDGYWRSCVRNRDASWDVDPAGNGNQAGIQQRAGLDFAQYSCGDDRRTGTCAAPPPVALPPEGAFERPPAHGVCDTALADRAADLPWMGMGHHSQFKCVRAVDPIAPRDPRARPYEHPYNAFHALADAPETAFDDRQSALTMNQCSLAPAAPGVPPSVTCTPVDGQAVRRQDVGFASVRYVDTSGDGVYTRGCIDEWKPAPVASPRNEPADVDAWRDLCPGHRENPIGVLGAGNPGAFGRLSCGCTAHTGGAHCEIACAEALFTGDNAQVAGCDPATGYCPFGTVAREGRVGLWMCGGVTTTSVAGDDPAAPPYLESTTPGGTTWTLRQGEFPAAIRAEFMQENPGDPNAGWRLR